MPPFFIVQWTPVETLKEVAISDSFDVNKQRQKQEEVCQMAVNCAKMDRIAMNREPTATGVVGSRRRR